MASEFERRLRLLRHAAQRLSVSGPSSTYQPSYTLPIQRWFKFKEAYSPDIVLESLLHGGAKPRHVCDPFGGSGTTALTALHLGLDSTTIELNPFLADVIRAKVRRYSRVRLENMLDNVFAGANIGVERQLKAIEENAPPTLIEPANGRFVFRRHIARRLVQLRESIAANVSESHQPLFRTMLAACITSVSNVVVNGKGRRYRRNWSEYELTSGDLDNAFTKQLDNVIEDLPYQAATNASCKVIEGDARTRTKNIPLSLDFAIFSPPYPNSFDYTDIYNLELWMLGYLRNRNDNARLRRRTLRSHVQIKHGEPLPRQASSLLAETMHRLKQAPRLWNPRIPSMVADYFADLSTVIIGLAARMDSGGRIVCVVGDSLYAGVRVDVSGILRELSFGERVSHQESKVIRVMRASAQQEWVLELNETVVEFTVQPSK